MRRHQRGAGLARLVARVEPAVDCRRLAGEAPVQSGTVGGLGMRDAEFEAGQTHDVVRIDARRELQRAVAKPFQQSPKLAFGTRLRTDAADVVHARGEHPVLPPKRLRLPTRHRMLFEQQHALAALGERRGGGQATDAGSDHDRVPHSRPRLPKRSVLGLGYRDQLMEINPHATSQFEESGLMAQAIDGPRTFPPRPRLELCLAAGTRCWRPTAVRRCTVTGSFRVMRSNQRKPAADPSATLMKPNSSPHS